ncbi:multicopper oxidase family protein [Streptomyces reniochalinae]|uniref:Multicopper oxidase family protein n=1 Tax=Streptomyces reniochalinae TaxID=2250578 RepID=A0A367F4F9_9ACTN|nr:multicopper oxidase family protein [Streptomyces reniochalinae]RCG25264.1 multicopper oxidase family protein [Streptomyces reniochalinae]
MVENLFEQTVLWSVLTAVLWVFAARGARRLAARPTAVSMRRRSRLGLVLLCCALVATAVRAAVALALVGAAGWLGGADYLLFGTVPVVVGGLAVAALTLPAYLRVSRAARGARGDTAPDSSLDMASGAAPGALTVAAPEAASGTASDTASGAASGAASGTAPDAARGAVPDAAPGTAYDAASAAEPVAAPGGAAAQREPSDALRGLAARTRLVVPVRACCVAALLGAACTLHPPTPPYTGMFLLQGALLALAAGALTLFHQRRLDAPTARALRPAPRTRRLLRTSALLTCLAVLGAGGWSMAAEHSRLPGRMGGSSHTHAYDTGGGPSAGSGPARDVADLKGDHEGKPDRRFTLTATDRTRHLASGEKVAALAFNGRLPGPELRVRRGELVEVVLVNRDVEGGVTLHWHGVEVPNAEDGVAGVTQDAVGPGRRHVYRFRPARAGTFWYHSHQQSSTAVARGLFGALIVEEPEKPGDAGGAGPDVVDRTVVAHAWAVGGATSAGGPPRGGAGGDSGGAGGALSGVNGTGAPLRTALGDDTGPRKEKVPAGTRVRLRLVNADNCPRTYSLAGTPFEVAAIDGNPVHRPTALRGRLLRVAGGGRYDVTFRQPAGPVQLTVVGDANASSASHGFEGCGEDGAYGAGRPETASLLLAPGAVTPKETPEPVTGPVFDPLHYGTPTRAPFGPSPSFDRDFSLVLGNSFGFFDGRPMVLWTINNAVYPDIPALLVHKGDLVRTTFLNRSLDDHPMHLHGHRMLVLSKDGKKATGSPWWTDTLNVAPGERYEVAFRADNPGLWMDHCHNLDHARDGMVLHLAYDGVTSPYETGSKTGNQPE